MFFSTQPLRCAFIRFYDDDHHAIILYYTLSDTASYSFLHLLSFETIFTYSFNSSRFCITLMCHNIISIVLLNLCKWMIRTVSQIRRYWLLLSTDTLVWSSASRWFIYVHAWRSMWLTFENLQQHTGRINVNGIERKKISRKHHLKRHMLSW